MAKLLAIANWPDSKHNYSEYPVVFDLSFSSETGEDSTRWVQGKTAILIQRETDGDTESFMSRSERMLRRDLERLVTDLKNLTQNQGRGQMTFVPIASGFELWLQRLSDDRYRAVVWLDQFETFFDISEVAYQGFRFKTNRARILGFIRALESELKKLG